VGTGIEWAIWNNWSIKAEYDYLDFGQQDRGHQAAPSCGQSPTSGVVRLENTRTSTRSSLA